MYTQWFKYCLIFFTHCMWCLGPVSMNFSGILVVFPNIKIVLFPKVKFVFDVSCVCVDRHMHR